MLELTQVVDYVLERGILDHRTVVEDGLVVRDVSSRNRNFQVRVASGGGIHLKLGTGLEGRMAVAREAQVYMEVARLDSGLVHAMPTFHGYDAQSQVLALGLVPDAEDLRSLHLRERAVSASVAALVGEALAVVHAVAAPTAAAFGPASWPNFLRVYQPSVEIFRNASAANLQLIRIVQGSSALCTDLSELRAQLRCESLLHNDIKWDNILIGVNRAYFVDWESALYGDPAWDVGSAFGQYLSWWLYSVPRAAGTSTAISSEFTLQPLASVQLALNALWTSYFLARGLDAGGNAELLRRAIAMTGVRLLQSAFEASQFATQLTSNDILHVQLAANILHRPREACHLLGLPGASPS